MKRTLLSRPLILANIAMNMLFMICISTGLASCNNPSTLPLSGRTDQTISTTVGDTVSAIGKDIGCIFQDQQGKYWFASNGGGVYSYDGQVLLNYTAQDGLVSDYVWNIQQDANGILWFTTRDGFSSFDGHAFTTRTFTIENAFFGKVKPEARGLFFPHRRGLCYYNGKSFINLDIHPESYSPSPNDESRPYDVYSTLIDNEGNAWFGTQSEGVCRFDGFSCFYLADKDLAGPAVRTIFQDKHGVLWFGNNGGGLFRYDGKVLTNLTAEKNLGNPEFLLEKKMVDKAGSLARVWSINGDKAGNLWIGTIDAGLWKYNGRSLINVTSKYGLPGNSIWVIYKDREGKLWIVTNGDTVFQYDGKKFVKVIF